MIRRLSTVLLGAIALILLAPAPAQAHVEILTAQPNGDKTTTLTFAFDHSCPESPTTELTVALPAEATPSAATAPAGWSATVDGSQVTWTGSGLDATSEFHVVVSIVARPGQALLFPTVQRCADGNLYAWTDTNASDEHPAPRLIATAAILASQPPLLPPAAAPATGQGVGLGPILATLAGFVLVLAAAGHYLARRAQARGAAER
jgi:uncharacterized protein YcnI